MLQRTWRRALLAVVVASSTVGGRALPATADAFIQQGPKLTGAGEIGAGHFGRSVAIATDGNTALIGANDDDGGTGAAWVFARSGSTWRQQGPKLTAIGETGPGEFGQSVALSADGNTALIGASSDNGDVGAAWMFIRTGTGWTQVAKLSPNSGNPYPRFGLSVALSADGDTALVGGSGEERRSGLAWVYRRNGSMWTEESRLVGNPCPSGYVTCQHSSRSTVALSGNGQTALVGGYQFGSIVSGEVSVFTQSGKSWSQQATLADGSPIAPEYGANLALSANGDIALVGEEHSSLSTFIRTGSTWSRQSQSLPLAVGVALSPDGRTALVGEPGYPPRPASVAVFTREHESWIRSSREITPGDAEPSPDSGGSYFGGSIAASADGGTVLVGGANDRDMTGAAWVFVDGSLEPASPTPTMATSLPTITNLRQSHPVWRESGDTLGRGVRRKTPEGTSFSFSINESAKISLSFTRHSGHKGPSRRCFRRNSVRYRAITCRRLVESGHLVVHAHVGLNRIKFQGLLTKDRELTPGRYVLTVIASSRSGQRSSARRLDFRIAS